MDRHERDLIIAIYLLSVQSGLIYIIDKEVISELEALGYYDSSTEKITAAGQKKLDDLYDQAMKKNPKKLSRSSQKRISKKIAKLRREGYSAKQAAAIAYKYERSHNLGPRGGKKKNPASICVAHSKKLLTNLKKDHPDVKYRVLSSDLVKHKGKWVCKTEMLEDCKTFTYYHDSL